MQTSDYARATDNIICYPKCALLHCLGMSRLQEEEMRSKEAQDHSQLLQEETQHCQSLLHEITDKVGVSDAGRISTASPTLQSRAHKQSEHGILPVILLYTWASGR